MPRLLVIGGMAAGMSGASKLRRLRPEWEATVLDAGEDLPYGACGLPYWIGGEVTDAAELYALSPEDIAGRGIEVHLRQRVIALREGRKAVEVEDLPSGRVREERYDALLIAAGARAIRPGIRGLEGSNLFCLHSFADGRRLQAFLEAERPRTALIWGTGYVALEMAENLTRRGLLVTVINRSERILKTLLPALKARVFDELTSRGVQVVLSCPVEEVLKVGERVLALATGRGKFPADLFLVATGVAPNTGFLEGSPVSRGKEGAILVDETCATGVHGIWAAGDCCAVRHLVSGRHAYLPLGTTANKMGRVAGASIAGRRERFAGVPGTAITRVFGLEVGVTGLDPREARAAGFDPVEATVEAVSRAGYCPGGGPVTVSLTADRRGLLLGGQVAGPEGTKGRIDVIATALTARMHLQDFASLDLAYAPPFSPVWDPLLVAAAALRGKLG